MKKLFLAISLLSITTPFHAKDTNIWKGTPQALKDTAYDKDVWIALKDAGISFQNLLVTYMKTLSHKLTPEQKKQFAQLLNKVKTFSDKAKKVSKGNQNLSLEVQQLGQQIVLSYLPLFITLQQEMNTSQDSSQKEVDKLVSNGWNVFGQTVGAMIQVLN